MSMNLHCEETTLWQTPTHITNMCYSNSNGGWKGILYRYLEWVNSHLTGRAWTNDNAYKDEQDLISLHIEDIHRAIKKHKRLHFYVT